MRRQHLRVLVLAREIALTDEAASGAERRLAAFSRQLRTEGVPALVYAREPARPVIGGGRAARTWRRLPEPARGLRRDLAHPAEAFAFVAGHLAEIRRFAPGVVLERAAYLDPAGAIVARLLGVPHVLELHGDLASDAAGYYRSPFAWLGRRYERRRYRRADRVVVVSQGLADRLVADGVDVDRIAVVPNGVAAFDPASAKTTLPGTAGRHVVGWIGRPMLWQVPTFERLVDELAEVDGRLPLALALVGPREDATAPALEGLRRRSPFPVVLPGPAAGDDADAKVQSFDVGIVPAARDYDLPVKLFHYAMAGVPVVAPRTRSIEALPDLGRLLYLFEPGGVAAAVEQALTDPARAERAAEARRIVRERHTWPTVVRSVLEACASAVLQRDSA